LRRLFTAVVARAGETDSDGGGNENQQRTDQRGPANPPAASRCRCRSRGRRLGGTPRRARAGPGQLAVPFVCRRLRQLLPRAPRLVRRRHQHELWADGVRPVRSAPALVPASGTIIAALIARHRGSVTLRAAANTRVDAPLRAGLARRSGSRR
jgi:hypothetical protein